MYGFLCWYGHSSHLPHCWCSLDQPADGLSNDHQLGSQLIWYRHVLLIISEEGALLISEKHSSVSGCDSVAVFRRVPSRCEPYSCWFILNKVANYNEMLQWCE